MILNRYFFITIFILFFILSCKNSNETENTNNILDSLEISFKEQLDSNTIEIVEYETDEKLAISEKCIIFFMPKKKEISKIIEHYGSYSSYDFQELFNDFKSLAVLIRSNVKSKNIHSELTTAPIIEIQTTKNMFVFKRNEVKDIVGVILYNGVSEPIVKYGMVSNYDLTAIIREYFSYNNFENVGYSDSTKVINDKSGE